jgi:N4-gp56 family major capsid protein
MQAHDWTFDAAVGIYKNHQLSKKLLEVAAGECKVLPFTSDHGIAFKRNAGEMVNIMHINRLPNSASSRLEEDTRIPIRKLSWGTRQIKVVEFGEGVEYTNLMEMLAAFKPSNSLQKALRVQMEEALDTEGAAAFMDATAVKLVYTPTSLTAGSWGTAGAAVATATVALTFDHCAAIGDYMRDTIHIPPYEGDNYVGLSANKNIRALKQDRYWQQWHQYLQKGDFVFKGEMGMTERIRWVEINRSQAFSNTAGNSTTLGEAVVFGDEAIARIEVETPHLRLDPNFQSDFGRTQAAAWYGILGFGSVWDVADDGKAKIVRIDSL